MDEFAELADKDAMPSQNRQIRIESFGDPEEVAQMTNGGNPTAAADQVVVRTEFAPINPADINVLEGRYGSLPELPAVIGNEGCGTIESCGTDVTGLKLGDRVIYLNRNDSWQDRVVAKPDELLRVHADLSPQDACMLKINPVTAWLLLHQYGSPEDGGWVVQNASNSGVGRAVIAVARAKGWRTINFVRREELIPELEQAGGDVVVLDDDDGKAKALAALDGAPVSLALNAVGGESALRVMSLLANDGTHITYGAMAMRPLKVPNGMLIFKNLQIRGLWLTRWLNTAPWQDIESVYSELAGLMIGGQLSQPVDCSFAPNEVQAAVRRARESRRSGKVLLDFTTA